MSKILKLLSSGVLLTVLSTNYVFAADDYFRCDRLSASSHGFKKSLQNDPNALNKAFPLELKIVIAADRSWAASYYGVQRERSRNFRNNDIIHTKNGFQNYGKNLRTTGKVNVTYKSGGMKTGSPAYYQCDKALKTQWEPER
jgi:hypothetical protein